MAHSSRSLPRRGLSILAVRARAGYRRVTGNLASIVQAMLAAVLGYSIAFYVFGHPVPFLAALAGVIGSGVTTQTRVRRSIEMGIGATIGVVVGELFIGYFGTGVVQMAIVLMISFLIGHVVNGGPVFVTQLGIQAVYVVVVPLVAGQQPYTRTLDALIGATMAILVAALFPRDPRKEPRAAAAAMLEEIAELLAEFARAVRSRDRAAAERLLARARETEGLVANWRSATSVARESTRINPAYRRFAAEVTRLARAAEYADRVMRLIRVVARRLVRATDSSHGDFAEVVDELARGAFVLREALLAGSSREEAAEILAAAARRLDPHGDLGKDLQGDSMVLLFRPMSVDLLQAAGLSADDAEALLPPLGRREESSREPGRERHD